MERLPLIEDYVMNEINLDSVTSATEGDSKKLIVLETKSIYVYVSGNTGAVTVNIQGSSDGINWANIRSTTYTAENINDVYSTAAHHPYMRVTTTNHTNATVKAVITGRT